MIARSTRTSRYFTYIEPVLKTPLIKTYGGIILTIAAIIIFTIFAIKPTIETILVLQKELANQEVILNQITQKSEDLTKARKNYQSLDPNIKASIQDAVPNNPELAALTKSLENLPSGLQASISALQFQQITIEPNSTSFSKRLTEVPFTYNLEGSYENLLKVLEYIKTSQRLITVDNLIFSKIEGGSNLLLSISGKAYYLK
ncbi:type 4a pilus biogenesis protein PilO [Candidatus Daviesbacteria bacterium]|nr:type 4a pilus biogenesis protein PilO [Candidatus Daviesbacteria bacterium]